MTKIHYYFYTVAFIDILGQKEAFKENGRYLDEIQQYIDNLEGAKKALLKAHQLTVDVILELRKEFVEFFKAANNSEEIQNTNLPDKQKELLQKMRRSSLKYHCFSDSMVAYVPLSKDKNLMQANAINGIYNMLLACGSLLMVSLAREKPFRAGVEVGFGTEIEENEIYGPVLYRAYEIESKIAQYPRIVIGEKVMQYFDSIIQQETPLDGQLEIDLRYCKKIAEVCKDMTLVDVDGCIILDYLSEHFVEKFINQTSADFKELFDLAFNFIEKEYLRFAGNGSRDLAIRYVHIYNYLKQKREELF